MRYQSRDPRIGFELDGLARLHMQRLEVEANVARRVERARGYGATWDQIAAMLAVSKQAARQRYGKKPTGPSPDPEQLRLTDALEA